MAHSKVNVILLHELSGAKLGETIPVKRGYAKNFLIPRSIAIYANEANKKKFETLRAKAEAESEHLKAVALRLHDKIASLEIVIPRQVGQDNKIFGTVNSKNILDEFVKHGIALNKNQVVIPEPIKFVGIHKVRFVLYHSVVLEKDISVIASNASSVDLE